MGLSYTASPTFGRLSLWESCHEVTERVIRNSPILIQTG